MAKTVKEQTAEEKLRALYCLQIIDSKIDKIREVRGELPLEVQDLEDEISGLTIRLDKINEEIEELKSSLNDRKNAIEESKSLIKKYEDQQKNVRNNREYDSLTKEVEFQQLEIQLSDKRIKEAKFKIDSKLEAFENLQSIINDKTSILDAKNAELEEITAETKKEEDILVVESEKAAQNVEDRLLRMYRRIRGGAKNGLAVVPVERGAAGGSFIQIPPQAQIDIAARKKVIVDEHSGRILVDAALAQEEAERVLKNLSKLLK
jgi:uncharacterized protein